MVEQERLLSPSLSPAGAGERGAASGMAGAVCGLRIGLSLLRCARWVGWVGRGSLGWRMIELTHVGCYEGTGGKRDGVLAGDGLCERDWGDWDGG